MRTLVAPALFAAALTLIAGGYAAGQGTYTTNVPSAGAPGVAGSIDTNFIIQAAKFGVEEVRQGQIHQTGLDLDSSAFAKQILTDCSKLNEQITIVASQAGMGGLLMHAISIANAPELSSAQVYLTSEVAAQKSAIELVRQEIKKGNDAQIRSLAEQMLPVLLAHLDLAEHYLNQYSP